jgi:hypothetical protein
VLLEPPPNVHHWGEALDDGDDDEDQEYGPGLWWLARSLDGSRLLLVHTRGVTDGRDYRAYYGYPVTDNSADHYGRTIRTYATGFGCQVFSMNTRQLLPLRPWQRISNLGAYSLFLE